MVDSSKYDGSIHDGVTVPYTTVKDPYMTATDPYTTVTDPYI